MKQLVTIYNNNTPITDSLTVSEVFGKNHSDVLRDVRKLDCSDNFRLSNFAESSYINQQGRTMPKYLITQDGFTFLAMGYTGKEAARFKEMYINEFNQMKKEIEQSSKPKVPQSYIEALRLAADLEEERVKLEQENTQKQLLIETQEPLVDSFNRFMDASGHTDFVTFGKMVGLGRNKIYKFLRESKVFMPNNKPYQHFLKYFKVVTKVSGSQPYQVTLLNPRGCHYVKNRLKKAELI